MQAQLTGVGGVDDTPFDGGLGRGRALALLADDFEQGVEDLLLLLLVELLLVLLQPLPQVRQKLLVRIPAALVDDVMVGGAGGGRD